MKKNKIIALLLTTFLLTGCSDLNLNLGKEADDSSDKKESNIGSSGEEVALDDKETDASKEATSDASESSSKEEDANDEKDSVSIEESGSIPVYKTVYRRDQKLSDDDTRTLLFEGGFGAVMIRDDDKDAFPELYDTLKDRAQDNIKEYEDEVESMSGEASDFYENWEEDDYGFPSFYDDEYDNVTRADSKILSIVSSSDYYGGGAHGYYARSGCNFVVATGQELELCDVIEVSDDEFRQILMEKLEDEFADRDSEFMNGEEYLEHYKLDPDPDKSLENDSSIEDWETGYNFYFGHDGLHIIFNAYDIADYATGDFDILFPYDEDFIDDDFKLDSSVGYVVQEYLAYSSNFSKEDAKGLHFELYYKYEGNSFADSITLVNGDSKDTIDIDVDGDYFNGDCYHIYTKDQREYIFIDCSSENDFIDYAVFDITDGEVKACGTDYYTRVFFDADDDEFYGKACWTNAEAIVMAKRSEAFGSFEYYNFYSIDKDGELVPGYDAFEIGHVSSDDITSIRTVPATKVEDGQDTGEDYDIPSGTTVTMVSTDGKSYIDVELPDGSIARLHFTSFEYPGEIEGTPADELFSGLICAG